MKTKTISVLLLLLVAMLCLFTACDETTPTPPNGNETTACLNHTFGEWTQTKAPTCTEKGSESRSCTICGHSQTQWVEAMGHGFGEWTETHAPTRTEKGEERRDCENCEYFETREICEIGSIGLSYRIYLPANTCGVTGMGTCTDTELYIPSQIDKYKVVDVGACAFSGKLEITHIIIFDGVTSIGDYAFNFCTGLTNITLPDSVTSIGNGAFSSCMSLTDITIPDSVTSIGNGAFLLCTELINITIPDSVTIIGESAFNACTNLTSSSISNSVSSIAMYTFRDCTSLTDITIPNSVTNIESEAFFGCSSLTTVYYTGTAEDWAGMEIKVGNDPLTSATVYFYSEAEPTTEGNFWRYVDGVPTPWA